MRVGLAGRKDGRGTRTAGLEFQVQERVACALRGHPERGGGMVSGAAGGVGRAWGW